MYKFIFSLAIIGLLIFSSCKDENADGCNIVFPDSGKVSYLQSVQPLFDCSCNYSGCHDDGTKNERGFSLTDYGNFRYSYIIIPGDTNASPLIRRIEGLPPGTPMPPDREPLNLNQKNGIRRWVLQGAQYN